MSLNFRPLSHGLPFAGMAAFVFAIVSVAQSSTTRLQTDPPVDPPSQPYARSVAATGLVEPASEVISVAIDTGGLVRAVFVSAGDRVEAADPLFAIDDRDARAALDLAEADVGAAKAASMSIDRQLIQQHSIIAEADARVESTMAEVERSSLDRSRYRDLLAKGWTTRQRFETASSEARRATAGLSAARAGAATASQRIDVLAAEKAVAVAETERAEAALRRARIDLDKTVVTAPIAGTVLKSNLRPGEYAEPGVLSDPLMTMGAVQTLHARVDVDETEAQRVDPIASAVAMLRGRSDVTTALTFVRFEPAVVAKRQLSGGASGERVDTRVLQVLYAFDPATFPAFVGQQVDVFIEARPPRQQAGAAGPS